MSLRAAALLTLFTLLPVGLASAQFTTYVAPPAAKADSVITVADSARLARDTSRLAITNMKAWVDSAAGQVVGRHLTSTDPAPGTPAVVGTGAAIATGTTTFRDGSRAPDTATPLPTLALLGSSALAAGLLLLRGRRRDGA